MVKFGLVWNWVWVWAWAWVHLKIEDLRFILGIRVVKLGVVPSES